MDELTQIAEARKYDSSLLAHIAEIRPGIFALYHGNRQLLYTGDWSGVLDAYRSRPALVPRAASPTRVPQSIRGITINL